jgi:DNA polymerase-1
LIRENNPSNVIIVWDGEGGSAKRKKIYSNYKAGRKPCVNRQYEFESVEHQLANMKKQYNLTKKYVELLGILQVEISDIEADDVIALICKHLLHDTNKVVVTSDKDMLQLVDDKTVVYSPTKKIYFSSKEVKEKTGVIPENYIFMKAFTGDNSDNIDGIKGFGEKTVLKLFPSLAEKEMTLHEIISYASEKSSENIKYKVVVDNKSILVRNVELMQLSVPIISCQSVKKVREGIEKKDFEFVQTAIRLQMLSDGIQMQDMDFFSVFKEYHVKSNKENGNNE